MSNNFQDIQKVINDGKLIRKLNSSNKTPSEASLYRYSDDYYVVRKIGKNYNLSAQKLYILEKNINEYYRILKNNLSLGLPKIFLTQTSVKHNVVLLMTEYFPKNKKVIETKTISEKIKYFRSIAKAIMGISSSVGTKSSKLFFSIDPNPDNFFVDCSSKVIYNDFTPPLYRKGGRWTEFRRHDEIHAQKSEKEKRYFSGINLLIIFINKTRLYLPTHEYFKFLKWILVEINKSPISKLGSIKIFPQFYAEISENNKTSLNRFKSDIVLRDILRFKLSLQKSFESHDIKKIYELSKKPNGQKFLSNKLRILTKKFG